jgi:hypothetical protein
MTAPARRFFARPDALLFGDSGSSSPCVSTSHLNRFFRRGDVLTYSSSQRCAVGRAALYVGRACDEGGYFCYEDSDA